MSPEELAAMRAVSEKLIAVGDELSIAIACIVNAAINHIDSQASEIERLRTDNDDLKGVLNRIGDFLEKSGNFDEYPAVGLSVESALQRQAARIQELEDAHKRSGVKYAKIINELRSSVYAKIPSLQKQWDEVLAEGKIGQDANKSHLRPYEVVAADLAGMMAKSWQITDERKAAIKKSAELFEEDANELESEEYSGAYAARQKSLGTAAVLRAMLEGVEE